MKIAILCEGFSEYDSIPIILSKFSIFNYSFLKNPSDTPPSNTSLSIYRHNYKNMGKLHNEYLRLSDFLIGSKGYDKVIVWCDSKKGVPICEFANAQKKMMTEIVQNKILLLVSVKCLENWFISHRSILSDMFSLNIDDQFLIDIGASGLIENLNVDFLNANGIINSLKTKSILINANKQKVALKFFSCLDINLLYNSHSLSRFIKKLSLIALLTPP